MTHLDFEKKLFCQKIQWNIIFILLGGSCCENDDRVSKEDRKDQYLHEVS